MRAFLLVALLIPALASADKPPPKAEETVVALDYELTHCVQAYVVTSAGGKLATPPEALAMILLRAGLDYIRLKPSPLNDGSLIGAMRELATTEGPWSAAAWPPKDYEKLAKLGSIVRKKECQLVKPPGCSWVLKAPEGYHAIVERGEPALIAAVVSVYSVGRKVWPGPENCKLHGGTWSPGKQ